MNQINQKIITFLPPEEIEALAKDQLVNISELPFVFKHIAVMPDCHLGKGATVGSVIATKGAIIPAAVGVDIGCGMIAVKTKFTKSDMPADLSGIRNGIERRIPLSAGSHNSKITPSAELRIKELEKTEKDYYSKETRRNIPHTVLRYSRWTTNHERKGNSRKERPKGNGSSCYFQHAS